MRKLILLMCLLLISVIPVSAMEAEPPEVPESGELYMPDDTESFGEALWYIVKTALSKISPEIAAVGKMCLSIAAIIFLSSISNRIPGSSGQAIRLCSSVMIGIMLLSPSGSLIQLGAQTISEMAEYGKLLIPVLTAALAAQGGVSSAAALCAGTTLFSSLLTSLINIVIIPLLYIYLCLSVIKASMAEKILADITAFVKWLIIWIIKIILYVFIGYIGVTGVVSGTADASAVRATKLTISGMVPIVGGIISEASETILVSAGVMKSAAGVYGIIALLAVLIGPFLKITIQFLMFRLTGVICAVFGSKSESELLTDFSTGMGMLLAATGTVCLLLLISVVCMMKGMS